jgi:RHS repeat-associated protein
VTSNYTYDPLYELTQVTQNANTTETYTYDPVGNRLSSLGVSPYVNNTSNELTSTPNASYSYDYNGNTTSKTVSGGTTNYTWDYENRLASVALPGTSGSITFKYDPFGRRIQKAFTQNSTTTTSNYLYDGSNTVADIDQNGNVLARYAATQNIDEPLAELRSGTTSYYEADGLGSVTSLTSGTGAIANTYTYDSFGKLTASTGSITNRFQYTAREFDAESGLYYYRARYYDSTPGRFLSEDLIGVDEGWNLYAYVSNRPLTSTDPSGRFAIDKSCKGQCYGFGGGGPNNPNQPAKLENLESVIQQQTEDRCNNLQSITDPRLRACVQKSCDTGTIKCKASCPPDAGEYGGKILGLFTSRTANLCPNNWPDSNPEWYVGAAVIHEWAHGCGWEHGQGGGVPLDPGKGR